MRIIKPGIEFITRIDGTVILQRIEQCGRICTSLRAGSPKTAHRSSLQTSSSVVITANIREWRHFLKLRCSKAAHPQIREVVTQLLKELRAKIPVLFDDIEAEV